MIVTATKKQDGLSQMIIFIVLYPFLKCAVMQEISNKETNLTQLPFLFRATP